MNNNPLKKLVTLQKEGKAVGIYSACSANKYVIEATLKRGKQDNSCVLIESTANQCDQNGGYTGMTPLDFKNFVLEIADKVGFDKNKLFLGGDHLGPLTWTHLNEKEAMENATELIKHYVGAGFTKIHIDTSMKVNDDDPDTRLSDETIAKRGAYLAKVAQDTYAELLKKDPEAIAPIYIVGSEVPIPGGAVAKENANNLKADVEFLVGDMLQPLIEKNLKVDVFVSNPPYIPQEQEIEAVVKDNEPHVALFGGNDGLYFYRKIFEGVNELLNERALLAFEMGFDQRELMEEALQKYFPNDPYEIIKDINGKDRMLFIYRNLK